MKKPILLVAFGVFIILTVAIGASTGAQPSPTPTPPSASQAATPGAAGQGGQPDAAAAGQGTGAASEAELSRPEEYMKNLEAQRRAIAREQEALVALRAQVKSEIEKLLSIEKKLDERLKGEDVEEAKRLKKLVQIYSAMSAEEIVSRLERLDETLQLRVLSGLKPKVQAQILALMPPAKAAEVTKKLAEKSF